MPKNVDLYLISIYFQYAVFLLIIIIVQVVIAILVFVYIGDLEKAISESLKGAFEEVKSGNEPAIEAFNSLQSQVFFH